MPYSAPGPFLGAQATTGYRVSNSLRFRRSASAYLGRTPSVASNRTTYTWSGWVKRGTLGAVNLVLFGAGSTTSDIDGLQFLSDAVQFYTGGGNTGFASLITTQVFRDPSAWYHIMVAVDTTQATASNRVKIYVNGAQVTAFSSATYPNQNTTSSINNTVRHAVGAIWFGTTYVNFFDGYLAEVNFIDGQALTPSSFGENDATTGVWKAKAYTGTYTGNSFYLKFADNSGATATTIGKDSSGLGNNWTPTNISVTAGTTYDSMIDTPTPYDDGGNGVGNYATLNPVTPYLVNTTLSQGNLVATKAAASSAPKIYGTIGVTSGKWYWEVKLAAQGGAANYYAIIGVSNASSPSGSDSAGVYYFGTNDASLAGYKQVNGVNSSYGANYVAGDTIGVALDCDNLQITFYKNNTSQGVITGLTAATYFPRLGSDGTTNNATFEANFGQRPFTYTPPSGFKALNTQNLPTPTIAAGNAHMGILTWTGTSTSSGRTFTGLNFQPDLIWAKLRSSVGNHQLYDVIRGTGKRISSNLTDAETTNPANGYVSSFNSDGFTTSAGSTDNGWFNELNSTYVAWQWKAGGTGVTNTSGSITSTVSANVTAGFSVCKIDAPGGTTFTFGHGLGVAPSMVIVKSRTSTASWLVYHASATTTSQYLVLNSTAAVASVTNIWGTSAPTPTVMGGNSSQWGTGSDNYIAYCFAAVAGYSAFGSYTGNGSADGPFVFTGFRPRWIMIKNIADNTTSWSIWDTSRSTYNVPTERLEANASSAESSLSQFDILSNGFKLRAANSNNASGQTIIYAAFAEVPFRSALAR